jgi:hypothetical protein
MAGSFCIPEQCYIVFCLSVLSRNVRKEVAKSQKIYFYDLGMRNALLQTFAFLPLHRPISERFGETSAGLNG